MRKVLIGVPVTALFLAALLLFSPSKASAHCDTLDGPVVTAARKALDSGNANYVFIWVRPADEDEIRKALKRARDKRKLAKTKEEKEAAEMEFFASLVKIHREGEGASYEGIKPAGSVEPEIAMADEAVKTGKLNEVLSHIPSEQSREVIAHLFHHLIDKSQYDVDDVLSGREFIESYVTFIHTVEKAVQGQDVSGHQHHH